MGGSLRTSLPLYLSHNGFWRDRRLWFPDRPSVGAAWSCLLLAVPPGGGSSVPLGLTLIRRLRLRLRLGLLRHASVGGGPAFHGSRAVLEGHWLRGVGLGGGVVGLGGGGVGLPVRGSQLDEAVGLLVAALRPPFDGRRLLQGEIGAVGLGLAAAGPSLQGGVGLGPGDVLLRVAPVCLRALAVALQTCTKYTLTENSYIHGKGLFLHKQSKNNIHKYM